MRAVIIAALVSSALAVPSYGYGEYPAESSEVSYPVSTEEPYVPAPYPTSTEEAENPYPYPTSTEEAENPYGVYPTSTEEAEYPTTTPCETSTEEAEYPSSTPCETSTEEAEYPSYPTASEEVPTYPTPTECPTETVTVTVTQGGYTPPPYPVPTGGYPAPSYPAGTGTGGPVYPTSTPPPYEGAASNVKAGMAIAALGAIAAFFL